MVNKSNMVIIIVVILLLIVAVVAYTNFVQDNQIRVGDLNFKLPNGYHEGTPNSLGHVNITNGSNCVFLTQFDDGNVNKYINMYRKDCSQKNQSIEMSNMTVNNILIYKSTNLVSGSNHYWFINNGKTYTVYNWEMNDGMDGIISYLVGNINHSSN